MQAASYRAPLLLAAGLASAVLWWSYKARRKGDQAAPAVSLPAAPDSRCSDPSRGPIATAIQAKVSRALQPSQLVIHDDSAAHRGHAGVAGAQIPETHFKVEVVSAAFEGVRKLERQRQVQDLLKDEFAAGLHALELSCRTPAEHAKASRT
ncbi:BOLA1 [Symbiodinium natans]|uniref:BOLA1 protein n=1 Tax=Symbiodinium natans TaxID=878477 RepID=A0A812UT07_9DINO|nr:BOLA1 [Symbiodinium natans]